ncbi:MAG: energy-coupling factor transporter transmembrane protein EcfT [Lachnospiraceae bacterium]|nr:energy-coupling factor transporter transmembrane protein EcfT [Ruminococcus sp.]MCM1276735.1 energy-coupling factor transporter transmembrane protein EcfT [Lachnospiraceae bacterium]
MEKRSAFGECHPVVNLAYFGLVIGFSMFLTHPVCLLVSLLGAVLYYVKLKGRKAAGFLARYALPIMLTAALINPLFNHRGATILCYLPTGNPLTLESIAYGLAAAVMLACVLVWFGCFSEIMTSDKLVYLFGKIAPSLSLVLSMTLRFVPRFVNRLSLIRKARSVGGANKSALKNALACFSAVTAWALEGSIETADSMKSRGYGLRGRTAFSLFAFTERDKGMLLWLGLCAVFLLSGAFSGNLHWQYFPSMGGKLAEPLTIGLEITYLGVCATPFAMDIREDKQWSSLRSKI